MKVKLEGKTQRQCDNCKKPLTHELPAMKGKFGQAKRINEGVTTIQWTRKLSATAMGSTGKTVSQTGEWCKECASTAMAVFMDSLLEKM